MYILKIESYSYGEDVLFYRLIGGLMPGGFESHWTQNPTELKGAATKKPNLRCAQTTASTSQRRLWCWHKGVWNLSCDVACGQHQRQGRTERHPFSTSHSSTPHFFTVVRLRPLGTMGLHKFRGIKKRHGTYITILIHINYMY